MCVFKQKTLQLQLLYCVVIVSFLPCQTKPYKPPLASTRKLDTFSLVQAESGAKKKGELNSRNTDKNILDNYLQVALVADI